MKKITALILSAIMGLSLISVPTFATNNLSQFGAGIGKDNANILKGCADRDDGIMCILELIVDIMSIGVGILGVIGISIVGVQYLTAGGSEEKTRKAKRRMFEIIIGIAIYVVMYALLKFFLPGFNGVNTTGVLLTNLAMLL